jgi:hypothetical protein
MMMMMSENQTSGSQFYVEAILGTKEFLLWTLYANHDHQGGGSQFSPYTSHVMGGGEGEGIRQSTQTHNQPGWNSHHPADHSCTQGLQQYT